MGRPPKFSPEETKRRLIDAALETLVEDGLTHGLDAIRLDRAIASAEVPRGAAYRVFSDSGVTPQDAFRRSVLIDLLQNTPVASGLESTRKFTVDELAKHAEALAANDADALRWSTQEMIRVVAAQNFDNIRDSQSWRTYRASSVTISTQPSPDPGVAKAIREGEERLVNEYAAFYTEMAELFRLRLKPGYTITEFSISAYALNEGLANRMSANYRLDNIMRPTGREGEMQPWTLLAIGLEGLIDAFFEPID